MSYKIVFGVFFGFIFSLGSYATSWTCEAEVFDTNNRFTKHPSAYHASTGSWWSNALGVYGTKKRAEKCRDILSARIHLGQSFVPGYTQSCTGAHQIPDRRDVMYVQGEVTSVIKGGSRNSDYRKLTGSLAKYKRCFYYNKEEEERKKKEYLDRLFGGR